jgi:CheY-like chemotaxis protein
MRHYNHNPVVVSLDVVWPGSSGKTDARMSEVSMDGCYIDSRVQGRSLGEMVDFKVHLPSGPWVSLTGKLINEDYPMGFGVQFKNLTETDRRLLAQVVAAHSGEAIREPIIEEKHEVNGSPKVLGKPYPVLVADDDLLTLRMVTAIIETQGYGVVAVEDGREALHLLQGQSMFSAAIFDMKMPHVQGLDLILYMKADERLQRIPVGMITAEQDPKVWDDSVTAGASVFLPKPFTPPQVQMMLRMLISKAESS